MVHDELLARLRLGILVPVRQRLLGMIPVPLRHRLSWIQALPRCRFGVGIFLWFPKASVTVNDYGIVGILMLLNSGTDKNIASTPINPNSTQFFQFFN